MKVLRGGSTEIRSNNWFKFDVELDESDLQAIVVKNNIDYDKLTVGQKYQLLVAQAELLVTLQMEAQGATGDKSSRDILSQFNAFIERCPKLEN